MAKFIPGPVAAVISGKIAGTVFTRGRYGPVMRRLAIPTKRVTAYTNSVRGVLTSLSKGWGGLTDDQRMAWNQSAIEHPVTDALGQSLTLQGSAFYIKINQRILDCAGTVITLPPIVAPPDPVSGQAVTAAPGAGAVSFSWTSGALGATEHLFNWYSVVGSAGREYYANRLRLTEVSAAAAVTPLVQTTKVNARFGTLIADQVLRVHSYVVDSATGLVSGLAMCEATVA